MDAAIREFVRERANHRCEYCHLPQSAAPFFAFPIEHIHARQHVLDDSMDNASIEAGSTNLIIDTLGSVSHRFVTMLAPRFLC
jgi:hypothetical protein